MWIFGSCYYQLNRILKTLTTILEQTISYQSAVYTSISKQVSIRHFLEEIKNGTHQRSVEILRILKSQSKEDEYSRLKKDLPAVTFCGTFISKRSIETLQTYNELLIIDIDKINDAEEFQRISDCLNSDSNVFSFWISPSGTGFKGLINIKYSRQFEINESYLAHRYAFQCISDYFNSTHRIELDKSGSDTTRLCITSYDKELVIKETFQSFQITLPDVLENKTSSSKLVQTLNNESVKPLPVKSILYNSTGKNEPKDKQTYVKVYKYLSSKGMSITESYDLWFRIAIAIANSFTYDLGEKYFLQLCRLDGEKHDEEKSKNLLLYCYSNNKGIVNFETILFLAKEKGFKI